MTQNQQPHICLSIKVSSEVADRLRQEAARRTIFENRRITVSDVVREVLNREQRDIQQSESVLV